ncbi:MAG: MFS transporter [Minisyncoccia bacterium]
MKYPRQLKLLLAGTVLFAFQAAVTTYTNATFFEKYINESWVGIIYTLASILTIVVVSYSNSIINKFGIRKTFLYTLLLLLVGLWSVLYSGISLFVVSGLVCYMFMTSFGFFIYDLLLEHYMTPETTGHIRGLYLLAVNIGWLFAPSIAGFSTDKLGITSVYAISFVIILALFVLMHKKLRNIVHKQRTHTSIIKAIKKTWSKPALRSVMVINFALQWFYVWMVIYIASYLRTIHGLSSTNIGIIFTVMLSAFLLLQFPVGILVDMGFSQKKLLRFGIIVMALATMSLPFIPTGNMALLALTLFLTRVGAATIEAVSEYNFFENTSEGDVETLWVFRSMAPFAYVIMPVIGSFVIYFANKDVLYLLLGLIVMITLYATNNVHELYDKTR